MRVVRLSRGGAKATYATFTEISGGGGAKTYGGTLVLHRSTNILVLVILFAMQCTRLPHTRMFVDFRSSRRIPLAGITPSMPNSTGEVASSYTKYTNFISC